MKLHGTSVSLKGRAVLVLGKPGTGKSSLALSLIDRGAVLIADDQTLLTLETGIVMASCPAPLKGLLEVRGLGLCTFPFEDTAPLFLVVTLDAPDTILRLPDPTFVRYHGVEIPCLSLPHHDALGAVKVELAMREKYA